DIQSLLQRSDLLESTTCFHRKTPSLRDNLALRNVAVNKLCWADLVRLWRGKHSTYSVATVSAHRRRRVGGVSSRVAREIGTRFRAPRPTGVAATPAPSPRADGSCCVVQAAARRSHERRRMGLPPGG